MSRFHPTPESLQADLALPVYRNDAARRAEPNAAEWIEALHEEHWAVLKKLEAARVETQSIRLVRILADLRLLDSALQAVHSELSQARSGCEFALGETQAVGQLTEALADFHRALKALRGITEG